MLLDRPLRRSSNWRVSLVDRKGELPFAPIRTICRLLNSKWYDYLPITKKGRCTPAG